MPSVDLHEALLTGGLRHPHFFNGRVLTAEALQAEQAAQHTHARWLGQSIGTGVVRGLEVRIGQSTGPRPTVIVSAGQAVNRAGQLLAVPDALTEVEVVLVRAPRPAEAITGDGLFAACTGGPDTSPADTPFTATGQGAYVLVLAPAADYRERVPGVGLTDNGTARSCGSRFVEEGVQFRLEPLDVHTPAVAGPLSETLPALMARTDPAGIARTRNLLAHLCLGTPTALNAPVDLFRALRGDLDHSTYGPLDALRLQNRLTDGDVPLALIRWAATGLQFVDMWAVRRRLHRLDATNTSPFPATDRRRAEAEAAFLQFQQHVADLTRPGALDRPGAQVRARDFFAYLPAAGVIPLDGARFSIGLHPEPFFAGRAHRPPGRIEGARLRAVLAASFDYPPIDLEQQEMVWIYQVRENTAAVMADTASRPDPFLLFTNGHMPFAGEARYDLSRWDFSQYASDLDA
ncbi:MAG: hypothetical protein D6685_02410 [Bacteroidetes bacterium]|nr:MAG: hypothetical protein D6685_02410 [Bacteroidota bacterium]